MVTQYVGQAFYTLLPEGDTFRIREKRVCLDNDILQPRGSIGIIL
jgi:3-phenylpropionate/cinnamic acid dioxygenase small subunit